MLCTLSDAIARYRRSQGYDVFFQTGTDEHGQKIELKAEEAGVTPKQYVDEVAGQVKEIWDLGRSSNGNVDWKDEHGTRLADLT